MFCYKCGAEIQESNKFCPKCGASQENTEISHKNAAANVGVDLINEGKILFSSFFSKEPLSVLKKVTDIKINSILIVIYILLSGLVINNNLIQIVNKVLACFMDVVSSRYGKISSMPDLQLPIKHTMMFTFIMITLGIAIIETVGMYIILYIKKVSENVTTVINHVALSYFPMILGLVANFILGFIYAPLTLGVYISCMIIHLIFLYEVIKDLLKTEKAPVWEYSIYLLIVSVIFSVVLFVVIKSGINSGLDALENYVYSGVNNILDSLGL